MGSVDVDGVSKEFDGATALDDVSLSVRDGEFFSLVGPSGCGKTTTLRAIAGLEPPTRGTIRFDGADVAGVPVEERGVGLVFQQYALFEHMTVAENVAYGLRFHDPPDGSTEAERVADLLDLVDLAGFEERDPGELSGGQQQRVALARALAPGPDLLLLDEPMSALDARLRDRLRRNVKEIQRDLGVTTVYVTHDQAEALAVSDRVAVMHGGRVEQVGTPREVYRAPETRFVASFVGENNLFDGTVTAVDAPDEGGQTVTVAVDDHAFRVRSDRDASVGDAVTVCVRPEHLDVAVDANQFEVTVGTAEFQGARTTVHAAWDDRDVVVTTDAPPEERATATLGFRPDDAVLV
ncbi:ABC transporter ATP-binding protein [Halocalculus aciditolerans]|uniref:Molybdate/tungstate import ATP-binding protein WtpC n=1 Tax=Halocalculus aciditolerans TaxID=1383812 RepID=A0A830FFE0_9EURY|nr:ABC transporter ATP-binding protein [Halocalculus aciditolerans]GGL69195.1 ABC transporter [Halocalculus aciditolerans]